MNQHKKTTLFWLLAIVHIWARYNHQELVGDITKIALIPCLVLGLAIPLRETKINLWGAIIFSWLGDIFLIPNNELFFLMGVGGFWVAQLCYCTLIRRKIKDNFKVAVQKKRTQILGGMLIAYLIIVLWIMTPRLENLFWPIAAYASTLALTVFLAAIYFLENNNKKGLLLFLGALLFMISDSMIAFDAFYFEKPFFTYWIMVTYIPAQFLLINKLKTGEENVI